MTSFTHPNPFPVDALPELIRQTVFEVQRNSQAPLGLVASSALSAIALACQNEIDVVRPNGQPSPCSLFILTIAESGERKSTVDSIFMQGIKEFEDAHSNSKTTHYDATIVAWEIKEKILHAAIKKGAKRGEPNDHLITELADHYNNKPKKPRRLRLLYSDTTPEALMAGLHEHWSSACLHSAEAGIFFGGRATTALPLFNAFHSGDLINVDRRTSESYPLKNVRFSIAAMIQQAALLKFMETKGDEARGSGLWARFLINQPQSTQGARPILHPHYQEQQWLFIPKFNARAREILEANFIHVEEGVPRKQIKFSHDAKLLWAQIYNKIEYQIMAGGYLSDIRDHASKLAENIARVAALLHYFEGMEGDLSADTLIRAATICYWYTEEFKRLFAAPQVPQEVADANILEMWITQHCRQTQSLAPIRKRTLMQYGPNALRKKDRLDAALDTLARQHKLSVSIHGKTLYVAPHQNYFGSVIQGFMQGQATHPQHTGGQF